MSLKPLTSGDGIHIWVEGVANAEPHATATIATAAANTFTRFINFSFLLNSRTPSWCCRLFHSIQFHIQFKHIHSRLSHKAQLAPFGSLCNGLYQHVFGYAARLGDTWY